MTTCSETTRRVLSLAGVIHYRPPSEAILTAQFLIGIGIGMLGVSSGKPIMASISVPL